jgi:integrase
MRTLKSCFAEQAEAFVAYRKASKNWCDFYDYMLRQFDNYCADVYPAADALSQEMVDSWCKQHETEINNSCRVRIYAVINFIKYLRVRKLTCVNPPLIPQKQRVTYIPHAFTEAELTAFFNACDTQSGTPPRLEIRSRKLTLPVFFRLLYSSGIRTNEARMLSVADVDLTHGILSVRRSKGANQHYVALHDSMLTLMRQYDEAIAALYPNRSVFFPGQNGGFHGKLWLEQNFNRLWATVSDSRATAYAFRHHYAVSNINSWMGMGFDFDDKFLYLSKSMGHRDIESTKYYFSITPGLAELIEEKTNDDFENIVPEVRYEKGE